MASYQFTRCLWADPAAPFCARQSRKVSFSLSLSLHPCVWEENREDVVLNRGHSPTHLGATFSGFLFTRYFLFLFECCRDTRRAFPPSPRRRRVCVVEEKNWINIHQGGWMLSINRITLVKERDGTQRAESRVDWNWRVTFSFFQPSHPSSHPARKKEASVC